MALMWGCFSLIARAQMFTNIRATQTMTVRAMVEDGQKRIWFAAGKSVYRFDGEEILTYTNEVLDRLGAVNSIALSSDQLLVGSERGMAEMSLKDGSCRMVEELAGRNVRSVLVAGGHEWAGTDSVLYRDRQPVGEPMGVEALCPMDEGVLVGTRAGVLRLNPDGTVAEQMLWDNPADVVSLSVDTSGDILMGTVFGLVGLDRHLKKMTRNLLFAPVVKCAMRDPRGVLLMGCDGGLYECLDLPEHIRHDARDPRSFAGNVVWCMMKDHAGNLWIGSDNGLSVMTYDQSFAIYSLASITESGQGNQIYCMHMDSKDRLWIGGTNGIVRVENFGRNHQHHVWYERDNADGRLPHNRIRMFYEDPVWGMWACTDGGLLHYEEETEQWLRCAIPEDLHNWVYSARREEDALVVNTFDGVYRLTIDDATAEVRHIQRIDATPNIEYAYGKIRLGNAEWSLAPNGLVVRKGEDVQHVDLPEKFISIYYHAGDDRIFLGGADQIAVIKPKTFLQGKAQGLWFDPNARFAEETDDNALSRTMVLALCLAVVALVVVLVLYFLQRRRLQLERARRQAMLKSAADKMALLEQDNTSLHQQLRMQNLAMRTYGEEQDEAEEQMTADEEYLLRVNKVIEEHIDNPDFSVAMLSEVMGVSKKQLYRKIKQCSDQTAVEYIRKLRLQKAASLLRNPRFTINEVMYMVGFSNPSYFSRSFTSEFGMTPTEYRSRK